MQFELEWRRDFERPICCSEGDCFRYGIAIYFAMTSPGMDGVCIRQVLYQLLINV